MNLLQESCYLSKLTFRSCILPEQTLTVRTAFTLPSINSSFVPEVSGLVTTSNCRPETHGCDNNWCPESPRNSSDYEGNSHHPRCPPCPARLDVEFVKVSFSFKVLFIYSSFFIEGYCTFCLWSWLMKQILEYAERRASILGQSQQACPPMLGHLAGRRRRQGWDTCEEYSVWYGSFGQFMCWVVSFFFLFFFIKILVMITLYSIFNGIFISTCLQEYARVVLVVYLVSDITAS